MYACRCTHPCGPYRSQRLISVSFLPCLSSSCLKQSLSLSLELMFWIDWLASEPHGKCLSEPQCWGSRHVHHICSVWCWDSLQILSHTDFVLNKNYLTFTYFVCECTFKHLCHSTHVEVREQLVGHGPLLPLCGFWGLNPSCQGWQ